MREVIIYATPVCHYVSQAKALFDNMGVPYKVIDISIDTALRQEMVRRSGGQTSVPQIFIGGLHIGGFDRLYALYSAGDLTQYLTR